MTGHKDAGLQDSLLGQHTAYPDRYSPEILFAIPRQAQRENLGLAADCLPFRGEDIWNCYELSWLLPGGKPVVCIGEFRVPADSPYMVESKSFKLYLNSLNQATFASQEAVRQTLREDLSRVAGAPVAVQLQAVGQGLQPLAEFSGRCLDQLEIEVVESETLEPAPELLAVRSETLVGESLYSHLLKSNCPVTGQPDWATVWIDYRGRALCERSLLKYLISFRLHSGFHENCVERIFVDLQRFLEPVHLSVYARYLRRGGLDINPVRTTLERGFANIRMDRQ